MTVYLHQNSEVLINTLLSTGGGGYAQMLNWVFRIQTSVFTPGMIENQILDTNRTHHYCLTKKQKKKEKNIHGSLIKYILRLL